jgi:hypothetical protein
LEDSIYVRHDTTPSSVDSHVSQTSQIGDTKFHFTAAYTKLLECAKQGNIEAKLLSEVYCNTAIDFKQGRGNVWCVAEPKQATSASPTQEMHIDIHGKKDIKHSESNALPHSSYRVPRRMMVSEANGKLSERCICIEVLNALNRHDLLKYPDCDERAASCLTGNK